MTTSSTHTVLQKPVVALIGNPNAGKTTLFNSLTGSQQKVGNYAGVTVEMHLAEFQCNSQCLSCVDVPGLYSLNAISKDEEVATGVLSGSCPLKCTPDLLVFVLDASNLERNLYFFSQIAEANKPVVVALTMTDVLAQHSFSKMQPKSVGKYAHLKSLNALSDLRKTQAQFSKTIATRLATLLGIDVVPVVAHRGQGIQELKEAIETNLKDPKYPNTASFRKNAEGSEPTQRYQWAAEVRKQVIADEFPTRIKETTDKIDNILTHRIFGLGFFVILMLALFEAIYALASPIMDGITWIFDTVGAYLSPLLHKVPMLQSLVVDGILCGVGSVVTFLPQIAILFFFISVLEGTGYLARAAFLMDKLLGWCGLNGRAFIPLLSSYACAIPGIMAARVIPDRRSRLATILIAPLMSCSARLPVYVLLIGAFVEPQFGALWAGATLFGMHLLGLLIAIPIVWILNKGIFKTQQLPFILELPPYQAPKWKEVGKTVYARARDFVKTAGTTIFVMSIIIWALLYFPHSSTLNSQKQLTNSYLGRFGKAIEPILKPAGFDWRISTAIVAAFPARENLVSSLGIIFHLSDKTDKGSKDLHKSLQKATWPDGRVLFTSWTAVGLMAFFALCCQCMATLAIVSRETGSWKWAAFMFTYMTGLAYLAAVFVHWLQQVL